MTRVDMRFTSSVEDELRRCERQLAQEIRKREEAEECADIANTFGTIMSVVCIVLIAITFFYGDV